MEPKSREAKTLGRDARSIVFGVDARGEPSVADFHAPPGPVRPYAGEVAAVPRRRKGLSERRRGEQVSEEPEGAAADGCDWNEGLPVTVARGIGVRLRPDRTGERADRENGRGQRSCGSLHARLP